MNKICTVNRLNKNLLILVQFSGCHNETEDKDRKVRKVIVQGKEASKLCLLLTTLKPLYMLKKWKVHYKIFIETIR